MIVLVDGINITENLSKYKDINITIVINGSVEKVYSDNHLDLTVNGSISECVSLGRGRVNSKSINGNISIKEDKNKSPKGLFYYYDFITSILELYLIKYKKR